MMVSTPKYGGLTSTCLRMVSIALDCPITTIQSVVLYPVRRLALQGCCVLTLCAALQVRAFYQLLASRTSPESRTAPNFIASIAIGISPCPLISNTGTLAAMLD
ncbi:hypothetical protein OK016_30195 [Vibrio chagasii]|nr:hypothetical protein [Vibrio chagasii]